MRAYLFIFNGEVYFSPSKKDAKTFIELWNSPFSKLFKFKTNWKIKHIERAPIWFPKPVITDNSIEYA